MSCMKLKGLLSAFYFALKKRKPSDEQRNILLVRNVMNATNSFGPIEDWQAKLVYEQTYQKISKLDNSEIKDYAGGRAKEAIQRRKDDMSFLAGFNFST